MSFESFQENLSQIFETRFLSHKLFISEVRHPILFSQVVRIIDSKYFEDAAVYESIELESISHFLANHFEDVKGIK